MSPKRMLAAALIGAAAVAGAPFLPASPFHATAQAQEMEHPRHRPELVMPPEGAVVANPVTVAIGFVEPDGQVRIPPAPPPGQQPEHRGPRAFLAIDAPPPQPGAPMPAGPQFVPFPEGQHQMQISLAPGQHQLVLIFVNREGVVAPRMPPGRPVHVTVR